MRIFGKGKCKFIANFSATMVTSLPLSLSLCLSVSLSLSLSLSHQKYPTHNIGSASALPIIRYFADDALQVISPKAHSASRTFPGGSAFACNCCLEVNAALLQLCGFRWQNLQSSHEVSPRLARQCGSQENQRVQASRSNLQVLLNKVRTLGSKSSLKRQTQGRLEGDR